MNMKDIVSYEDIKSILNKDIEFLDVAYYKENITDNKITANELDCKYALFGYALELLSLDDVVDVISSNKNSKASIVSEYLKELLNSDRYIEPNILIRVKYLIRVYWGDTDNVKSYANLENINNEACAIWYEYFSKEDTDILVEKNFLTTEIFNTSTMEKVPSIAKSFLCINNTLPTMLTEDIALYSLLINNTLKQLNTNQKDLLAKLYPNKTPLVLWNYRDTFLEFLDALSKRTIHY